MLYDPQKVLQFKFKKSFKIDIYLCHENWVLQLLQPVQRLHTTVHELR